MKIRTEIEFLLPTLPSFLLPKNPKECDKISIATLSEKDIEALGAEWTQAMIKKAIQMRTQR